jgi:8-oxo-dGTP pyrophosphatase MutT (NUDIX family)
MEYLHSMNKMSNFRDLQNRLKLCFEKNLPGMDAHLSIAPIHRKSEIQDAELRKGAVKSSVLILFYEKENESYIVFIRRPHYNGVHSGQISFPGGRWEMTDKSLYHTALRETREEIGINTHKVKYAGKLTDLYIPPSNYIVSPYVAFYDGECRFDPDPAEVAEIIEVPFAFLLEASSLKNVDILVRGVESLNTPAFVYNNNIIWGATAMILNELIVSWENTKTETGNF